MKERDGLDCWFWNEEVGEAGDEDLEVGWDKGSKVWDVLMFAATVAMLEGDW